MPICAVCQDNLTAKRRRCHNCGACQECCSCDDPCSCTDGEECEGFDRDELGMNPEED